MTEMQIVKVVWEDAGRTNEWGFYDVDDFEVKQCVSFGMLVAKDKEKVVVAPHIADDGNQTCGAMTIPRSAVRSITFMDEVASG